MSNDNLPPNPVPANGTPDTPKKFFVRFSKIEDEQKVFDFYDLNTHKNVLQREKDLMKGLIDDGAVVIIEDEKGTIVAASITYPHKEKDSDGVEHVKWQEVGTTRIALNGYPGLFDAMITMQVLRAFLVEPPEERFVAQMFTDPVQKMAGKLGWRRLDEQSVSPHLVESKEKMVPPGTSVGTVNWFHMGREGLPVMAAWMVKTLDNPVLENKKTGEKIQLDFSKSSFFNMFQEEIKHLAKRDFGSPDAPDMQKGVQQSRDKWLKNFFR
ncbi:MAG TPA: hypothetical protein PLX33_00770 [Alphaproteobacteria bacterium]|nr:hypothetical protein [Alphaproteobacteria bacterium]